MICSHFVIHWKLVIIIIKTAKNEHSNDYHYYFKVTIGFQCLTTIRQYAMGSKGLGGHANPGGGGAGGLDPIGKSHVVIWVDLDLNPLPPLTKFPGSAHGGGNLFHWNALEQARGGGGGGGGLYQLGAWDG